MTASSRGLGLARSLLGPRLTSECQTHFWQQIARFYASDQLCDLHLHCSDLKVVKCHNVIMATVSGFFKRLLGDAQDSMDGDFRSIFHFPKNDFLISILIPTYIHLCTYSLIPNLNTAEANCAHNLPRANKTGTMAVPVQHPCHTAPLSSLKVSM